MGIELAQLLELNISNDYLYGERAEQERLTEGELDSYEESRG
jgi:hypothetical protein